MLEAEFFRGWWLVNPARAWSIIGSKTKMPRPASTVVLNSPFMSGDIIAEIVASYIVVPVANGVTKFQNSRLVSP